MAHDRSAPDGGDYWSPYGNCDMLDRTWRLAFTNNFRRDELIEMSLAVCALPVLAQAHPDAGLGQRHQRELTAVRWRHGGHRDVQPAGAAADLAAFALDDFRMGVTEDPLRTLVLNGTARDAVLTMVAGRVVMRDGVIPGVDLPALRRAGQQLFDMMRAAYPERDHRRRTVEELFSPVFPRG
ncbi:hypothetical protein [Streptomyces sp. SID2888]|uniref:hypothetical protein n=1 Tax=Streptomyces sp. SID2888 TaxID=2690256 RepID=UPI00192843E1|nr:hypothetical protein [Streptomyces sp. SID2888]